MATTSAAMSQRRVRARDVPEGFWPAALFAIRLNLFGIALSALWNPLNTLVLPDLVSGTATEGLQGSALGLITFLGIGIAAVVQPIAGSMSDRAPMESPRKGIMIPAGVATILTLLALSVATVFWWLLAAYIALQLASNAAQAAFQALIPDHYPKDKRTTPSGVKTAFGLLGTVLGLGAAGLLSQADVGERPIIWFLAAAFGLGVLAVWKLAPPDKRAGDREWGFKASIREAFAPLVKGSMHFRLAIFSRFLFLLGLYPVQRFLRYYLEDRFELDNSLGIAALAILAGVLIAAIAAAAAGGLSKLVKERLLLQGSIVAAAAGVVGIALLPGASIVVGSGLLLAVGVGAFQAINWGDIAAEIPDGEGARYFGVANMATAGASAAAGLFGPVVDVLHRYLPTTTYQATFTLAALLTLSALLPLRRIKASEQG